MNDPSAPLNNSRHEAFAQAVARAQGSDMAAYVAAGYSPKAARQNATELRGNTGIKARIAWLASQAALATVLSIAEKREICAEIARKGDKATDRLKAIEVDNDLAPEVETPGQVITIRIGA